MTLLRRTVLIPALVALAACSAAERPPPSTVVPTARCIDHTPTTSWIPIDERTVLVRSVGRAHRVTMQPCVRLRDRTARISQVLPGGSRICSPRDVRLYVTDMGDAHPLPCYAQSLRPISEAEAVALERAPRR